MKDRLEGAIRRSPPLHYVAQGMLNRYRHRGSRSKWRALANDSEICLEFGSGPKKGRDGWTTVDVHSADIDWDLRRGIPLPDGTVDRIYTSHLLEHIPYPQLLGLLRECLRVLKTRGEFLVCVPNFRLYVEAYMEGRLFKERETWWEPARVDTGSAIDQLNYQAYMKNEHKYLFDEENLVNTLSQAGFSEARLREFDASLDLPQRDAESVYALAVK